MSFGKKDIIVNISSKAQMSKDNSKNLLEVFLDIIKSQTKSKSIKISKFGSFIYRITPERIGRNPKSKEEFLISKRQKLVFKTSTKIKELIN